MFSIIKKKRFTLRVYCQSVHIQRIHPISDLDSAKMMLTLSSPALDGLLQKMSAVLQRYGVDPRELSQEQLYKLALILQLLQSKDKTGTVFQFLPVFCSEY